MQTLRPRRPGTVHISAPSFPTGARPSVYRKIAYTFIGLTVVVILGVLWLTSVRADVNVKLKQDSVRLDGVVEVARTPSSGQIPGRVLKGTYTKTREFQVLGEAGQPSNPTSTDTSTPVVITPTPTPAPAPASNDVIARGTVRIINTYSKKQTLVKTTRLLTPDNKLYRIDATVTVPPGGEVSVAAYADQVGSQYVLTAPTKFTIPGLFVDLQKFIYAQSDSAFTGVPKNSPAPAPIPVVTTPTTLPKATTSKTGQPVTKADIDRAEKSLTDEVLNDAMKDLAGQVENRDSMDVVYVVNVVNKSNNATIGQVTDTFLSSIKLDVTAVYYSKDDMQALVRSKLKDRVPGGREFLPFTGGAVTYALESADPKTEIASIRVTADANYRLSPTSPLLQKSVIAGKSADEAKSLLSSIDGVDSVEIIVHPSWMTGLPALKDRINLNIQ
jgi:hypothetical protein